MHIEFCGTNSYKYTYEKYLCNNMYVKKTKISRYENNEVSITITNDCTEIT